MTSHIESAIYLALVGIIWGSTNPLIKKNSSGVQHVKSSNRILQSILEITFLITNFKWLIPFLLNQVGSVLYVFTLQDADLSMAVPVANSISFVCTAIVGTLLGERSPNIGTIIGMLLVLSGITLCVIDKSTQSL